MASLKIHEQCKVGPPSATATLLSLPLTFFDLIFLRLGPIEQIFFYSLPPSQSDPCFFFDKVAPKLKTSLSLTLQHFLPLVGNIVWPSDSPKPIIQFNPGVDDGVSFILAQCDDANFNQILEYNSPHKAIQSRTFLPHLESNESFTCVISLQITLFPNSGFCIGISANHAVLDGKSLIMFIKAWASLCKSEESLTLGSNLEPSFNRDIIKDPNDLGITCANNTTDFISKIFPINIENDNKRSLKNFSFELKLENSVRATFKLTRADLDKIKKTVLAKWDEFDGGESKPQTLSTFVVTCAYVLVCIAKAIHGVDRKRDKFGFMFMADCRARLEPPIPNNYFGNCLWLHFLDTQPLDFLKKEGLFYVAKSIYEKIKMIDEKGVFVGAEDWYARYRSFINQGINLIGVSMSNRFGVYESDFGWGRPAKVDITSADTGLTIGLAESRDARGGVEVGLVLNTRVMDLFTTLFREGMTMH